MLILLVVALAALAVSSGPFNQTVIDIFIRVMLVVGLYVFIGNSGVISFGHIGFTCLGAYATAWLTMPPPMKKMALPGLPDFIIAAKLPFPIAIVIAAIFAGVCAFIFGKILMRLSGIAASIATFAMLAVINQVYSNWEDVTGATSSIVGIPIVRIIWPYFDLRDHRGGRSLSLFNFAVGAGVARGARRGDGGALHRGSTSPANGSSPSPSAASMMGLGGALYAHSVGVVTPDTFYLGLTFISLSMLVVGGMNSLSGAVIGVVLLSTLIQILRWFEKGVPSRRARRCRFPTAFRRSPSAS